MPYSASIPATANRMQAALLDDIQQRLVLEQLLLATEPTGSEAASVVAGLQQQPKTIPPRYFYDDRGSELFEQICGLPEYYPTRTEAAILVNCAPAIADITGPCELVELGSGSSTKTRLLLDAYQAQGSDLRYLPIDVSGGMLEQSAIALLTHYPTLNIYGLVGTYEQALQHLPSTTLPSRMISFLGSTLGNLTPLECDQFFAQVQAALKPGEYFLLGVDLQKPKAILEAAYNDAQGVTAAFNLNMLAHLNWRFEADFDLTGFRHLAFYNESQNQIEMHLESLRSQTVELQGLNLTIDLAAGETLHTEISRKFDLATIQADLRCHQLHPVQTWTDEQQWFGVMLCQRQA